MAKRTIHVVKKFDLTHEDGSGHTSFKPGRHHVEDHVADHWFVKAHCEPEVVEGVSEEEIEETKDEQPAPVSGKGKRK